MYVGTYRFAGDPAVLVPAYDRMMEQFDVEGMELHVCAVDRDGIAVIDACPTEAVFRSFQASVDWSAFGLPAPSVTHLGEVHEAHLARAVRR